MEYGYELYIIAQVDKNTGRILIFRYQEVVEDVDQFPEEEITNKINFKINSTLIIEISWPIYAIHLKFI